jgi:hypothetical protein
MALVEDIQFGHFVGRVGQGFEVPVRGHRVPVVLEAAQELPGSPRPGGGFRLEFLGPHNPVLAQGIFPFEIGTERFEMFVVPIGRDVSGTRYEALFY